jgi:hypothetical protein
VLVRSLSETSIIIFLTSFVLTGCGSNDYVAPDEQTVPAAGVISYQGKPLDYYRVNFLPAVEGKRPASAVTDANGQFVLGTDQPGDGAVTGTHVITVEYVGPPNNEEPGKETFGPPPEAQVKVPSRFASAETSELMIEIPEKGNESIVVNID